MHEWQKQSCYWQNQGMVQESARNVTQIILTPVPWQLEVWLSLYLQLATARLLVNNSSHVIAYVYVTT